MIMLATEFDYYAPRERSDCLRLLAEFGPDAKVLAGGQSLMPMMNLGLVAPRAVVSLNHLEGLSYIKEDGDALRIGALTTHDVIASDPLVQRFCPALGEAARVIGDVQIRHRGTIGGSVCHADPAADYLPVLCLSGASFRVESVKGSRTAPSREFFTSFLMTALAPGEMLVEVSVPKAPPGAGSCYLKLARVEGNFAIVCAGARVRLDRKGKCKDVSVALGGVGPRPLVLEDAKGICSGKGLTEATLKELAKCAYDATTDAPSDLNADAEYRRHMAGVFARRAVQTAAERCG
jgi:CO/xanthine dehydrogenase FAD-binding subunit